MWLRGRCASILEDLKADQVVVEKEEQVVNEERRQAEVISQSVAERRAECQVELVKAQPIVDKAIAALDTLSKASLSELKSFKSPSSDVVRVMTAVIILLNRGNGTAVTKDQSWQVGQ